MLHRRGSASTENWRPAGGRRYLHHHPPSAWRVSQLAARGVQQARSKGSSSAAPSWWRPPTWPSISSSNSNSNSSNSRQADAFCAELREHGPAVLSGVRCLGPWGPNSRLYGVSHPLYRNDRPPHVAGAADDGPIDIHVGKAYVCGPGVGKVVV